MSLTAQDTLSLEYISSYFVRDASSGLSKADFTNDADVCLFDHRLMVYGIKLKFLTSISEDTTGAMVDYARALEFAKGHDSPRQKISLLGSARNPLVSTANYVDSNWTM